MPSLVAILLLWSDEDLSIAHLAITCAGLVFLSLTLRSVKKYGLLSAYSVFFGYGTLFFFIVPLIQISFDYWPGIPYFPDREYWVAWWLLANLSFLPLIVIGSGLCRIDLRQRYTININRFYTVGSVLLLLCVIAHFFVLARFGGVEGYIAAYELRIEESIQNYNPYDGLGFLFTFSESVPKLLAILSVVFISRRTSGKKRYYLLLASLVVLVAAIFFGGMRGSRSNVIWVLIWFATLYHLQIRSLKISEVILGACLIFAFANVYALFKYGGIDGITNFGAATSGRSALAERTGGESAMVHTLIRDVGRTDVQSYIVYRSANDTLDYALGRSLIAGGVSFVPSFILPYKPDPFTKEKTDIFIGKGLFSDNYYTTLLVGFGGEFYVNFGVPGLAIYYVLVGFILQAITDIQRKSLSGGWRPLMIIYPVGLILIIQLYIADSNVIAQFLFKYLTVPLIVIAFSLKRAPKCTC